MAKAKGTAAIVENARNFVTGFKNFSAGQKAVVIAVVVALLGGAIVFSRWASTPTYTPMFTNLSGADASAMVEKLKADGVPYELTENGTTISVPQDRVYDERLAMSGAGLPSDSESGYALLDEQGVTTSEFVQQKTYQRALQDELENTIKSIKGVDTAVVNLAIPTKDVFLDEQDPTTASVLVGLKPGAELSGDQVTSVVNLVAGGVEGMDPKNVSVVDDEGNTLSSDASGSSAQQEKTSDYNTAAGSNLQAMLESVYGEGNVKATVNATLNFDDVTTTSTQYTQPEKIDPLASSTSKETYEGSGAGAAATGVLGPDNIQVPGGTTTEGGGYAKESSTLNNSINRTDQTTKQAPGKVERQSVAVVVDAAAAGAADVNQITQIVTQAAGIDAGRGDTVSVVKTAFDASAAEEAAAALAEAEEAEEQSTLIGYAKTAALGLLVLIMLVVILLAFRRRKVETVDVLDVDPLQLGDITADDEQLKELPPVVERPVALEAAPVDPALEAAAARRTEVVELVSRQPEEVAELLRGWLADRRS
ncbi:flagellar M-ring protein FliF [Kineococcus sp. T13]|uniref:flagellar basal-body MS-ring/collar protein FliF n=1 Tax=Kineococcus vitellinus TaxID=2696565 RepID=UPI00141224BB|nr:flagellar basal-body MS-ring/collar protein FliF [Kineococcus vitellinus]NAZ76404.1 flagellar M-ring protein FliF [Kineococcus vitellinus]